MAAYHAGCGRAIVPTGHSKAPAWPALNQVRGNPGWGDLDKNPLSAAEAREVCAHPDTYGIGLLGGHIIAVDLDDLARAPNLPRDTAHETTPRGGLHLWYAPNEPVESRRFSWGEVRAARTYTITWPTPGYELGEPIEKGLRDFSDVAELLELELASRARAKNPCSLLDSLHAEFTYPYNTNPRDLCSTRGARAREHDGRRALPPWLRKLDCGPLGLKLAQHVGAPPGVQPGDRIRCRVHPPDRSPSATLWCEPEEARVLHWCFHEGSCLSLAQLAARQAGRPAGLSASELACWKLKLGLDAELLEIPPSPELGLEGSTAIAWRGFWELTELRRLLDGGQPTPFSARFAAAWCGLSTRAANTATRELARLGLLAAAGSDPSGTPLWLPGLKGARP